MNNENMPWIIIAAFMGKEIITYLISNFFKSGEDHARLLQENTKEVIKLRAELNFVHQTIAEVPRMKQDISEMNVQIREIFSKLKEVG